jgi:uncharacterized OsmC-like protein
MRQRVGTDPSPAQASVGFRAIRLHFTVDTEADEPTVSKLIALTERYCVILQSLRTPPPIVARHEIRAGQRGS